MKQGAIRSLIIILIIVMTDLIIKSWITNNLEAGQTQTVLGGALVVANIKNMKLALGMGIDYLGYLRILFQLVFVVLFIRIQTVNTTGRLFKIASLLIVTGWTGNYIDKFLFSKGNSAYLWMDYLSVFSMPFINLSSLMIYVGWLLFFLALIIQFGDMKVIFRRPGAVKD